MARRLVLMRHAEAALAPGQADGDLFSLGDLPLSARGRAQAEAARDLLRGEKFDAAFASPILRARETAAIVAAPHGLAIETVPALAEYPFGTKGATYDDVLGRIVGLGIALHDEPDPALPDGSRYSAHKRRFAEAIDGILARSERPLVVAHGIANRVWLADALGMPPENLFRIAQDHACANVVELGGGRAKVLALNVVARGVA